MDAFISAQQKHAKKIKNAYSNLTKQGKAKISIGIIDSSLENLRETWTKFENNDIEIQKIKTEEHESNPYFVDEFFDAVEEDYVEVRGLLQERKNSLLYFAPAQANVPNNQVSDNSSSTHALHRKMPTIAIPKFNGSHSDWINYRDLFKSLVVDQPINNIEKFSYLRESLSNDPLILIKNIPVTEKNFLIAWQRLVEHYNNNKAIIYHHIQDLLNIKPMSSECQSELRRVINQTIDSVDSLEALGGPVDHWDWILVPLSANRLDPASRKDWEILTAGKVEPVEFIELKKFMQERLLTLEVIPTTKFQSNFNKDRKKENTPGGKNSNNFSNSSKLHSITKPTNSKSSEKPACFFVPSHIL